MPSIIELAVANALGFFKSKAFGLVHLIVSVRTFKEEYIAITLKGQYVRTNTVEEPTVVADNHRTTCKGFQTLLQGTQRVDINVVGWLIEQQHIALLLQGKGQLHTVTLTAR